MKTKLWQLMLIVALLTAFATPAFAEANSQQGLDIRVKAGSTQMNVNGQAVKITAPYTANGTTMLPMAVFTRGLGAKLSLKNGKTITLTYPKHKLVMTIGSKSAGVDGKKLILPAAPAMKGGVAFAPIKLIESLGAKVSTDASTKEIRISVAASAPGTPGSSDGGPAIDSDSGKTKIGDSYYQWSMNYPTGLVQDSQSDGGKTIVFRDVKGEYYMAVTVAPAADALSAEEQREWVIDSLGNGETVLDKRTVTFTGQSYAKIVSKDKDGFYYDNRGVQANGYFYSLAFGKQASSISELTQQSVILDSFTPSYDRNDPTLKDLSSILAGYQTLQNDDYGVTVKLPEDWKVNDKDYSYPYFETDEAFLSLEVSSLQAGDTLDAWVKRDKDRFRDTYLPTYSKMEDAKPIVWSGKAAQLVKISYSNDTKTWWHNYQIYAIEGEYRYDTVFAFPDGENDRYNLMFDSIIESMQVDFSTVENNFGTITDDADLSDRTAVSTKTSRKHGYSIAIPKHWTGVKKDFEAEDVKYNFAGGSVRIQVISDLPNVSSYMAELEKYFQDELAKSSDLRMVTNDAVTFAGQSAKKYAMEDKTNKVLPPNMDIAYVLERNGKLYMIEGWYYLANASEFVMKQLDAALNSFVFTNP